jgi:hypothetical protein
MRFSDTITEEQYYKLTRLDYERKPAWPEEIRSAIDFNDLHESIREIVTNLPVVEFKNSFYNGILDGNQQFYLMTCDGQIYLVDTQGYDYARYVIRLKDFVILEKADTMLMKGHPGMVEEIIGMLKHIDVDGETMEYILDKTGMKEQMLGQLFLKGDDYLVNWLSAKRKQRDDFDDV